MRIYSDILRKAELHETAAKVGGLFIDEIAEIRNPKIRSRGWILRTAGNTNRHRNSGIYGADGTTAASYDQHGEWFARLYAIDRDARIVFYESADDFHEKTRGKYRPQPA